MTMFEKLQQVKKMITELVVYFKENYLIAIDLTKQYRKVISLEI